MVELAYFNRTQGGEAGGERPSESQQQQRRYRLNSAIQDEREESMTRIKTVARPGEPEWDGAGRPADKMLTGSIDSVVSALSKAQEWPPGSSQAPKAGGGPGQGAGYLPMQLNKPLTPTQAKCEGELPRGLEPQIGFAGGDGRSRQEK